MPLNMEIIVDGLMPKRRPFGTFSSAAERLDASRFSLGGVNRMLAGVTFVPWGNDVTAAVGDVDLCGAEDFTSAVGRWPDTETQKPFSMWKGFECSSLSLGLTVDTVAARSVELLSRVADAVFTRELVTGAASGGQSLSSEATRPLGNTATALAATFAGFDDYFDSVLGNDEGIVWVPSKVLGLAYAADLIVRDGDAWRTATGHKVVGDGGFGASVTPAGGTAAAAGDTWVYASGPVAYGLMEPVAVGDGRQDTMVLSSNIRQVFAQGHGLLLFDPLTVGAIKLDLT